MKRKTYFISVFLLISLFILFYSCPSPAQKEKVATPVISPRGGISTSAQTITITCETEGATIYYTTDGTEPTTSSSKYEGSFIMVAGTVKAMAAKDNYLNSDIASETYYLMSGVIISTEYPWTRFIGTNYFDEIVGLTVDAEGYIYVAGTIGYNAQDGRERDVFLAKYDSKGNRIWIKYKGGVGNEELCLLAKDSYDNIYIVGYTIGSSFDGLPTSEYGDIFSIKFDKNGNWKWTKFFHIPTQLGVISIVDIKISGEYIYILSDFISNYTTEDRDVYIIKYGTNGTYYGAITITDGHENYAYSMLIKDSNNIYVFWAKDGTKFITKYDSNFTIIWKKEKPDLNNYYIKKAVIDNTNNNIYLLCNYNSDIYLIKLDMNGNIFDTKKYGGSNYDEGYDIYIDENNNKYITGLTNSSFNDQTNKGGLDILIIKLDSSDIIKYTLLKGGSSDDEPESIFVTDSSGKTVLYIGGSTRSSFDGQTNKGNFDGFFLKYIEQ